MAKEKKTAPKKPRAKKYDDKTVVSGSFLDIMKAAAKDANAKKEAPKP